MATTQDEPTIVDKTAPIVIPSLKTRTGKEWFIFAVEDRVIGKTGERETSGQCRFCPGEKTVRIKQRNGYSNFLTHMDKHRREKV